MYLKISPCKSIHHSALIHLLILYPLCSDEDMNKLLRDIIRRMSADIYTTFQLDFFLNISIILLLIVFF
jgi:hypothetical protein